MAKSKGPAEAGVPVSMRALVQRINRKLAEREECLKASRGERARQELGDYYVLNPNKNIIMTMRVNPERLARELGVLKTWETVVD